LDFETACCGTSEDLLGYPVTLSLLGQDLTQLAGGTSPLNGDQASPEPVDFFEYCHQPGTGTFGDSEKVLYRAFAYFGDHLQQALADDSKHVYYFSYPVVTSGWRHFLHIYVKANDSDEEVVLPKLWEAWKPLHDHLMAGEFLKNVNEAVQRASEAHYQTRIQAELEDSCRQAADLSAMETNHLPFICNNLPLLFPLRSLSRTDETSVYGYVKRGEGVFLGFEWRQLTEDEIPPGGMPASCIAVDKLIMQPEEPLLPSPRNASIEKAFLDLRLEQLTKYQLDWIKTSQQRAVAYEQRHRQQIREDRIGLREKHPSSLSKFRELARERKELPEGIAAELRKLVIESEHPGALTKEDMVQALFRRLFGAKDTLAASEFLGVAAIVRLTHPSGAYPFPERRERFLADLDGAYIAAGGRGLDWPDIDTIHSLAYRYAAEIYDQEGLLNMRDQQKILCCKGIAEARDKCRLPLKVSNYRIPPALTDHVTNMELFLKADDRDLIDKICEALKKIPERSGSNLECYDFAVKTDLHPVYEKVWLNANYLILSYKLSGSHRVGGSTEATLKKELTSLARLGTLHLVRKNQPDDDAEISEVVSTGEHGSLNFKHTEFSDIRPASTTTPILDYFDAMTTTEGWHWVFRFDSWRA